MRNSVDTSTQAAHQFAVGGPIIDVRDFGAGNVNDTYLVRIDNATASSFILQRINQHVFRQPKLLMHNLRTFSDHVHQRLHGGATDGRRWETPRVISTQEGQDYWEDDAGGFWRAITLIAHSHSHPTILSETHAEESGFALGRFQSLISDLAVHQLHDTLPGFHICPHYLAHFDHVVATSVRAQSASAGVRDGMNFVAARRAGATVLEDAKARGDLLVRAIHGDPKVDNIMIDNVSGRAVGIVDLDTVKPGLIHYDIGDCLRSCCNPAGEETENLDDVRFDTDLCRAILRGYLPAARDFLHDADYAYIYECIWLIAFELGLRFFTDYLAGDVYFKVRHPQHNLQRSLVQFRLAATIEAQEETIRAIVRELQGRRV